MKAFGIEKCQVVGDAAPGLAGRSVVLQIDLFVLEGSPEPFVEDVVERSVATIHADLDLGGFEPVDVLRAGEVVALIAVPDFRLSHPQCPLDSGQDEGHLQGMVDLPGV